MLLGVGYESSQYAKQIARVKIRIYFYEKEGFINFIFKKNKIENIFEVPFLNLKLPFKNFLSKKNKTFPVPNKNVSLFNV